MPPLAADLPPCSARSAGTAGLPAPSLEAAQWIALAEPAPFGRGKKTIIDPAVLGLGAAVAMMRPDDIRSR